MLNVYLYLLIFLLSASMFSCCSSLGGNVTALGMTTVLVRLYVGLFLETSVISDCVCFTNPLSFNLYAFRGTRVTANHTHKEEAGDDANVQATVSQTVTAASLYCTQTCIVTCLL